MLNIGICGVGKYGINLLDYLTSIKNTCPLNIRAFCAQSEETIKNISIKYGIKGYFNTESMLSDNKLNVVIVATPDYAHDDSILTAIDNKCHVFIEKPMTMNPASAYNILINAAQKNVLICIDFHKRYDPDYIALRNCISEGKIGHPLYAHIHMEDKIEVPTSWINWASKTSPIWFLGTHYFDLLRHLTNKEVISVFAKGQKTILINKGINTYDAVQCLLEFNDGFTASVNVGWVLPNGFEAIVRQGLHIVGTMGAVTIDSQDRVVRFFSDKASYTQNNHFILTENKNGIVKYSGYCFEPLKQFIGDLLAGKKVVSGANAYDGYKATEIAYAVQQSLDKGLPITLQE